MVLNSTRQPPTHRLWALSVAAIAGVAGAAARPIVIAGLAGVGLALATVAAPAIAVLGWIPIIFFGAVPYVETVVYGLPLVVGLILLLRPTAGPRRVPGVHAAIALVVWLSLSLTWAEHPGAAIDLLVAWSSSIVAFAVVANVAADASMARRIAFVFVGGVSLSVIVGLLGLDLGIEGGASGKGRLNGGLGDPNALAAAIVPAGALVAGLLGGAGRVERVVLIAAGAVLVGGLVETQSRGGLLAATACLAAWMIAERRIHIGPVVLVAVVTYALVTSPAVDRIAGGDDTGRGTLWNAAVAMARDHPLTGVGLHNFRTASTRYADRADVERYDLLAERPRAAHSTYLQLIAEAGAIGLALFLLAAGIAIQSALRAAALFAGAARSDLAVLSRCVGIALLGHLCAAVFLTIGSDKPLWILAGLAAGLRLAAREARAARDGVAPLAAAGR